MPRSRKTADPRIIALRDREQAEQQRYERWYRRLRRAVAAMEKSRRALIRIQARLRVLAMEVNAAGACNEPVSP